MTHTNVNDILLVIQKYLANLMIYIRHHVIDIDLKCKYWYWSTWLFINKSYKSYLLSNTSIHIHSSYKVRSQQLNNAKKIEKKSDTTYRMHFSALFYSYRSAMRFKNLTRIGTVSLTCTHLWFLKKLWASRIVRSLRYSTGAQW